MPGGDDDKEKKEETAESKEEAAEAVSNSEQSAPCVEKLQITWGAPGKGRGKGTWKAAPGDVRQAEAGEEGGESQVQRKGLERVPYYQRENGLNFCQYNLEATPEPSDEDEESEEEEEEEGFGGSSKGDGDPAASKISKLACIPQLTSLKAMNTFYVIVRPPYYYPFSFWMFY